MSDPLPDGLAFGKTKILQVEPKESDDARVIFQYYTEYGDDGVVMLVIEGVQTYVGIYALRAFLKHFDDDVAGKVICDGCGNGGAS